MRSARWTELLTRLFVVAVAVASVLGGRFVILPSLPLDEQSKIRAAAPEVFLLGLGIGIAIWLVDRVWPHVTGRVSTEPSVWWLALGLLIFLGERVIVFGAVGLAGLVVPSSFLRFQMSD